ncbi:MAG: DEAD/DEAH box helicase, partial [Clostridia bacterium]|nr:DEAD/DEAH box helicase [Clostridia bacterium]
MAFSPIAGAEQIEAKYLRYLMTLFSINDPVYQEQFEEQIRNRKTFSNGPYLEAHDNYLPGKTIRQLVQEKVLPEFFLKFGFYLDRPLYKHQEMAILKALIGDNLVVSTGTGSGKTESFLIPIFAELAEEAEQGPLKPGVRALLIYPMNALANDQIERLRELLVNTPEITFGSYTGQTKQTTADALAEYRRLNDQKEPLKNELISRDQMKETPPHILVTNYAMLEYLMVRPGDNVFFNNWSWKTVVMDEAHIYRGSTGIEVSMLIRRLNAVLEGCHLQYFLTSATLGDESENREVAEFATNLCDSPFTEKNIIRAVRAKVPMPVNMLNVPMDIYTEVEKQIEHEQTADDIGQQLLERFPEWNLDKQKPLFDMVHRDRLFWQLRTALKESRTARELSRELDIGTGELETVINVASFCEAGGIRLLDARYHMFLRATDSVFITLPPSSKLVLTRTKSIYDPKERESFKAFEISTCSSCHSIYLMGELGDNGCIEQTALPEKQTAFYLGSQFSSTDEDSKDEEGSIIPGQVCAVCGYFMKEKVKGHRPCEHGMKYMVPVIQVKSKSDDHRIKKCVCCESVNNRGILRPFFTGQEAVTSVLATSLFEALPATVQIERPVAAEEEDEFGFATEETSVTETKNVARQFLCFSDSRQASAYFATYLDTTYRKILYKRCIVEQLGKRKDQRLSEFCEDLQAIFDAHNVFAGTDARSEKENWKAILAEASDQSGDSSLSSLGIMKIGLRENLFQKNDKLNLSQEEVNALFNVLLDGLITDLAIQIPVGMTEEDREFYAFGASHGKYAMTAGNKQKYVKNFIPSLETYSNKRQDYLLRVMEKKLPSLAEVGKIRRLMENLWKQLLAKD